MKTKFIHLSAFLFSFCILIGCKKSSNPDVNFSYNKVKVYDDMQANIENGSTRIASGADRLYMTYSVSSPSYLNQGGYSISKCKTMATDNEGNLIWRVALPEGLVVGDLLPLNDGSCLVAARVWIYNYLNMPYSKDKIYLFRFNLNGQQVSLDSLNFPSSIQNLRYTTINLCLSHNGNPLLSCSYVGPNQLSSLKGLFACEYSFNGTLLWTKDYTWTSFYGFSSCLPTPDGGYLFFGQCDWHPALFKTNASGDSLWTKLFYNEFIDSYQNITPAKNGNFRFVFTIYDTNNYANRLIRIYEVDANGDSVKTITIDDINGNYPFKIISKNDGSVFVLKNRGTQSVVQPVGPFNTSYVTLDAGLNVNGNGLFQTETSDLLPAVCKTSEGNLACFGLFQSYNHSYYKPELLILK